MDERSDRSKDNNCDAEPWKLPGQDRESPFHSSMEQAAFICTYLIEQIEASLRKDLASGDAAICMASDIFHRSRSGEHLLTAITTDEWTESLQNLIETVCWNTNNEQGPNDRDA